MPLPRHGSSSLPHVVVPALARRTGRFLAVVLASALLIGCEDPFEPFQPDQGAPFSMFGYLDLKADTQWIRVMPIRQNLLLAPEPIDAVVTLEDLGSGRTITLNDSLFRFPGARLDGVASAYNFWTAEPLQPGASYSLRAVRSDGASTSARVVMPADFSFTYMNDRRIGPDYTLLHVRADHVLFVDVIYAMATLTGSPTEPVVLRERWTEPTGVPGTHGFGITASPLERPGLVDARRQEIRVAVGRPDWPFHPGLSDLEVALPGTMPSNVENGVGFVGGVATWTIPFHRCAVVVASPDRGQYCTIHFVAESASIAGRVIREPCGDPHAMADIRLSESYAGGGTVIRSWKTDWDGRYRFEGIEPGAELVLDLGPGTSPVPLPRSAPGERFIVSEISVPVGC
jgi:hypothetical protein